MPDTPDKAEDKKPWTVIMACVVMALLFFYFLTPGFVIGLALGVTGDVRTAMKVEALYKPVEKVADHWTTYGRFCQWQFNVLISPSQLRALMDKFEPGIP